jgi:hypothetical protein
MSINVNKFRLEVEEIENSTLRSGARGGAVVEALRYKLGGCRIDSRWCHWKFSLK